jgi:hypothetical protein
MSDETIKEKIQAAAAAEAGKLAPELSSEDMKQVVGGATNLFLELDGIKGESQDDKHKDEIL